MAATDKTVQITLPLESIIDTVCKLSRDELVEVKRRIDKQLRNAGQTDDPLEALEDREFWDSDLGREIMAEGDPSITREEVLRITSKFKGSMAQIVREERDAR